MKMEKSGGRVLMFRSREICYMSSKFFAYQLGAAFEELGLSADVCVLDEDGDLEEQLMPYTDVPYRLIVDFNSKLPRMELDDGRRYPDHLQGPFFDYVLDHPLFHYNGLEAPMENFHVIVLDESQKRYVERYYPNVLSSHMLPLAATEALYDGPKNAADHVCFLGTYDSPETVYELVAASPEPMRGQMKELIARRLSEPLAPMDEVYAEYLKERGEEISDSQFALFMNAMYPVDAYVRDYYRKAALDALMSHGIPVTVTGEGWEKYHGPQDGLLTIERPVEFSHSFEKIAKEQILLNVSPIFPCGLHDRVLAGMANRAAVLTDWNPYLDGIFEDGWQVCFYDLKNMDTLAERAGRLMEDAAFREKVQQGGYAEFLARHTWRDRAEKILEFAESITSSS